MNSLERCLAALEFRPVDHVAAIPLVMRYAAELIDAPYSAYLQDPKVLAEAQLKCQAKFGYDYVTVCSDGYREAEACGAELSFPHDSTPKVERPAFSEPADLKRAVVPDPKTTARMKDRVESVRIFNEAVGGQVLILGWVEAPFAAVAAMCGLETLLINLHIDEGFVRDLLEYALEVESRFAAAQIRAGANLIGIGDAAASLISPDHYRRLALPYERRLVEAVHAAGGKAKLHICGNTGHLLRDMAECGADSINIDWMVDLPAARAAFGTKPGDQLVCLKGNMDPVAVLLQGTPEGVFDHAQRDIEVGSQTEVGQHTGFILSPGCEVTPGTPDDNLHALVAAARAARGTA